ncbi:MAG TPA: lytic murein transglycosylase B [Lysobacter sp.]|nr:lytic murein transglycosylase B [Lysobacter sp.]
MIERTARRACIGALALTLAACATKAPEPPPQTVVAAPTPVRAPSAPDAHLPPPVEAKPLDVARAEFVRDTAAKYGIDPGYIEGVLAGAQMRDSIIAAMSRPAEAKPWRDYRPLLVTPARIDAGRAFLATHREALARVEAQTGVPGEVIVAILGIETSYGGNTGKYRVLDALYTLAFAYPRSGDPAKAEREARREAFFRKELGELFALGKETGFDITTLTGSYAGAMGWGQFMPSSYREFAVDGNGDGRRDLFNSLDDVFASVANYFVRKGGWVRGGVVAVPAVLNPDAVELAAPGLEPVYPLAELAARGYRPAHDVPADALATVLKLDGANGPEYWLGFQNFYAITRYNISAHYAMAVYQLAEAVAGRADTPTAAAP